MSETQQMNEKQARLSAIDAEMQEIKRAYRQQKRSLRDQRKAILHSWTQEEKHRAEQRAQRSARRREERRMLSEPPVRALLEEIGSSITHGAGAALSVVALILPLLCTQEALRALLRRLCYQTLISTRNPSATPL